MMNLRHTLRMRTTVRRTEQHRPHHAVLTFILTVLFAVSPTPQPAVAQIDGEPTDPPADYQFFLPFVQGESQERLLPPLAPQWDSRLTERGAYLEPATVSTGEGYWRLVAARWFDHNESQGRHHILIDLLDADGQRQVGIPVRISWRDGESLVFTEEKRDEAFATNYAMYALAPAYGAAPHDGAPADRVEGMGLGNLTEPHLAHHTSYGLTWQWTIAGATPEPTPTATATPTLIPTAPVTVTPPLTVTATPTVTAIATTQPITVTPTATPTPTPSLTPTPTATATPTGESVPFTAVVARCAPFSNGSRFAGHVYVNGEPADGYRVTFSYEADGPRVPLQPAISGSSGDPGSYAHILSAGVTRVGDWYAWLVDGDGQRISTFGSFHTDGAANRCNSATIDFYR
jgi:hypothetical protein